MKSLFMIIAILSLRDPALAGGKASYFVPVPVELEAYSTYEIASPIITSVNGKTRVRYDLPPELVGSPQTSIILEGAEATYGSTEFILTGDLAVADCKQLSGHFQCAIKFSSLKINPLEVKAAIDAKYISQVDKAARLKVANLFSADPHGILTY